MDSNKPQVGRPALFESNDALEKKIAEYFEWIKGEFHYDEKKTKGGTTKVKVYDRYPETPAITGLALFLGFESRQSIYDYEKNGEFSYTIKRARLKVEAAYEQALLTQASTGAIFALKNFGWKDKTEVDNQVTMVKPLIIDWGDDEPAT